MNTPNQWQLAGNAAERYERVLVPVIFAPWAADLVALAKLRPRERVLDVACGTGVVARLAAERVGREGHVTGLDLNEGMLEVARSQPIPAGAAAIAWVQSVWEGSTPYTTAMWNAVERHVGADAATTLRKSRAIEDSKALQGAQRQCAEGLVRGRRHGVTTVC